MQVLWSALYQVISLVFQIYIFIVIARALVSWVNPDPYNPIVRFLYNATEPVLSRMRRYLPLQFSGIDLSAQVQGPALVQTQSRPGAQHGCRYRGRRYLVVDAPADVPGPGLTPV